MEGSRKAKPPTRISIERGKTGGYAITHSFDNFGAGESFRPNEMHVAGDHKALMAHIKKHMPDATVTAGTPAAGGGKQTPDGDGDESPAGVAGKAKAAAPNQRTRGAGVD